MNFVLRPWQLFFICLSGWVNRQQQEIIEFQNAQIRALILVFVNVAVHSPKLHLLRPKFWYLLPYRC